MLVLTEDTSLAQSSFESAGATYTSYSPTPYTLGNLTKSFPVTSAIQKTARANLALGR